MKRRWSSARLGVLSLVALGALILGCVALSPPRAGAPLARDLGLPYRTVIAHRGASWWAPEETLPAYQLAAALGADFLELDLQRTADGVLFAFHDDTFERNSDVGQTFPERASQSTETFTWAEVQGLDVGSWFNQARPDRARSAFAGLRVPSLDAIIAVADAGGPGRSGLGPGLYIETKAAERFPGIEAQLVAALSAHGWLPLPAGQPSRVIFQSFSAESLKRLAALAPEVPRVLLLDQAAVDAAGWSACLDLAKQVGAGIGPVGYEGWPWRTGPAHRAGLLVHPYTLNAAWQMALLGAFGADGFFTDRADLMLEREGRPPAATPAALLAQAGY